MIAGEMRHSLKAERDTELPVDIFMCSAREFEVVSKLVWNH